MPSMVPVQYFCLLTVILEYIDCCTPKILAGKPIVHVKMPIVTSTDVLTSKNLYAS